MKFSVIVPVYNVAPYLRECLDSVCAAVQELECRVGERTDHPLVEVICVDDGSTDGSGEILDEYVSRQSNNQTIPNQTIFRVIHQENRGEGPARNRGLEVATGEWLCFVDADDLVHADWLKRCQCAIDEFPDVDMVRFGQIEFNDGERCLWPENARRDTNGVLDLRKRISNDAIEGGFWSRIYRRSKVANIRFQPYRVGEDWAWKVEAILCADSLVDAGGVLYGYRQRATSVIHLARTAEWIRATMDWPVHVLRAFSDSEKDIDPAPVRRFLADLVSRGEEYCLFGRSNGEDMWPHWCDAMVAVSRMRKVPWWFRIAAGAVSLTRLRLVGYLVTVPYKIRRLRFA